MLFYWKFVKVIRVLRIWGLIMKRFGDQFLTTKTKKKKKKTKTKNIFFSNYIGWVIQIILRIVSLTDNAQIFADSLSPGSILEGNCAILKRKFVCGFILDRQLILLCSSFCPQTLDKMSLKIMCAFEILWTLNCAWVEILLGKLL